MEPTGALGMLAASSPWSARRVGVSDCPSQVLFLRPPHLFKTPSILQPLRQCYKFALAFVGNSRVQRVTEWIAG
jgi:hypothetical protein